MKRIWTELAHDTRLKRFFFLTPVPFLVVLTSFHFKLSLSPTYMPRGCVGVWISYVCDLDMGHGIYSAFEIRLADYPGQRATIFSCLFPSNQFTQSPTIHVFQLTPAANVHYPVDQISRPVYPAAVEYLSLVQLTGRGRADLCRRIPLPGDLEKEICFRHPGTGNDISPHRVICEANIAG